MALNRRDFLLMRVGPGRRSLELSCERLYMMYVDARLEETTTELFEYLEGELRAVEELRLIDRSWLARDDLKDHIEPLLSGFRARGGRVTGD